MECVQTRQMSKLSKLEYAGVKPRRQKHTESEKWKRAKNVALQKQSRRENEFIEETLLPEQHLSGRNQRYAGFVLQQTESERWHKLLHKLGNYDML
jgi:hypothetical protein